MKNLIKVDSNGLSLSFGKKKLRKNRIAILKVWAEQGRVNRISNFISSIHGQKNRDVSTDMFNSIGIDELKAKKPNSILALFEKRFDVKESHEPNDKQDTWIGVEIECIIPYDFNGSHEEYEECDDCHGDGGFEWNEENEEYETECRTCDGRGQVDSSDSNLNKLQAYFKHNKVKYTNVKYDGSIEPKDGFFAAEITVLTKTNDMSNLKQVCTLLNEIGAEVNKSCGMHVHLDSRHLDEKEVVKIGRKFRKCLPFLLSMVPKSRRSNHFCKPRVSTLNGSRYTAVNLSAFKKYNTIEIRLHSSTTDFNKIQHWVILLNCIAKSDKLPMKVETLETLTDYVYIPENTIEHCAQRIALFNNLECNKEFRDNDNTEEVQLEIGA